MLQNYARKEYHLKVITNTILKVVDSITPKVIKSQGD